MSRIHKWHFNEQIISYSTLTVFIDIMTNMKTNDAVCDPFGLLLFSV